MIINGVHFPDDELAAFRQRHGVRRLAVFGSILREASPGDEYGFRPDSDIDILVEFLPGRTPGLIGFGAMILEMRRMLGREVDLRTPEDLSPYFCREVLREAKPLHAA